MAKANKKAKKKQDPLAKQILDKYATAVIKKDAIYVKDGESGVDRNKETDYTPETYTGDEVLWIPPLNWIRLEFEGTPKENEKYIRKVESALKVEEIDYCVSDHEGKSSYINVVFKNIPLNEDNKIAKYHFLGSILSKDTLIYLDKTNLGWTLSPIIGHEHWKKKYNGAIHKIIRGTNPLEQNNEYPKKYLKEIKKSKDKFKLSYSKITRDNSWLEDFFCNYCTNNLLPGGERHFVIEKNLASFIIHHPDRDKVIPKYLEQQGRKRNTLKTWFQSILRGQFTEVSPGEIVNYIKENNIDYVIPKIATTGDTTDTSQKPVTTEELQILKDPKLLLNLVEEIHKQGIIGEDGSILVLINKTNLRLVKYHNPTSSNTVVSDVPGAGKDILVKITTKVMVPKDRLIHRTRFSDKALEYFMTDKEEGYTLDGSVIYLEDPEEELLKSQAFRVMASGQSKVSVVKDQSLMELEVKGKPVILVTSMNATIDEEGGRRWDGIKIDTSEILTKKVIADKLLKDAKGIDRKYEIPIVVKAIQSLKPYEVIIPYALDLLPYFEKTPSLIMRTQINKLSDYIKSSAVLYQHQRKKDSQGRLIADDFDYEYGKFMFQILGDAEGGILSPIERNLIEILKDSSSDNPLSFAEISASGFKRTKQWIYRHLEELKAKGIVKETYVFDEGANKNITKLYSSFGYSSMSLPVGLVLTGFNTQCKNQQQRGFNGFYGFINTLKDLNEKRLIMKLSKIDFEDLDEKFCQSSLNLMLKPLKPLRPSEKVVLSSPEKPVKTNLSDRIKELKEYCEKLKRQGNKITYPALCHAFDTDFIERCKKDKLLIPLPGGDYDI